MEIRRLIWQGYSDAKTDEMKCVKAKLNREEMLFLLLAGWGLKGEVGPLLGCGGGGLNTGLSAFEAG